MIDRQDSRTRAVLILLFICARCWGQESAALPSGAILHVPIANGLASPQEDLKTKADTFHISFRELLGSDRAETNNQQTSVNASFSSEYAADLINRLDEIPFEWWCQRVGKPILDKGQWLSFGAASVLVDGLHHSPRVQAVAAEPLVTEADIVEADAEFDPSLLLEGFYGKKSDPVGNILVTGGSPRLREETFYYRMGVQRLNRDGSQFEATQELGLFNNNSSFLLPPNQGNSRLSMSLTQPLLNGAGRVFNERLIFQAHIDNRIAWQEALDEVQIRLADIFAAYWQLYERRVSAIQQHDLLVRGQWVKERIENRGILDASKSQIVRAQAAVSRREAAMIQATAGIGDQQSRLIALVGSPNLDMNRETELIPVDSPRSVPVEGTLQEAVVTGLQYHPRIRIAAEQLESAALAVQVTENQLLPLLNAVLETYLAGLNGNNGAFDSFADQFTEGEPGFSAGLEYNFPIGNRASKARHRRQRYVLSQQQNELREVLLEVTAEIEIAYRAMEVAKAEIKARRHTLEASRTEEAFFASRWQTIPSEDGSATFLLEDLLDAQERRTEAEKQWVSARVDYLISIVRLQQAMGTLLMNEGVRPIRTDECDQSKIMFVKDEAIRHEK